MGVDNKTPEFLAKNPLGKVPVLETDEGSIYESNAIARHLARAGWTPLFGSNDYEEALVNQWLDFSSGEIELPASVWLGPIFGYLEFNAEATNLAKGDIRKVLTILNEHLATRTFLVGERISLADIVIGSTLTMLFTHVLDTGFRKPFTHVVRWFTTLINQPNFKEVIGEFTFATKMAAAAKPEGAAEQPKQQKKEKPKAEKKPEAEAAPAEKKQSKPKKKKDDDEEEEDEFKEPEEPKGSNPLDQLPPTPFVLDEWKRQYSNNDGAVSIKWFFENLDKQGWSVYFCDFKYPEEQTALYKTCNLVGGFLQRLDKLRKYGFGSINILEIEGKGNFDIQGAWLFRGQDIPAEMTTCDDSELYTWRKADLDNEEDKTKITEIFNWEPKVAGKKFAQGKVFK
eukprot:TRINITY_DN15751_c0_g1_i1.p1 TRINITY_DN15751_c0_g1~~TRINITY_DN15751_c0_g1_i1.p1  ORF type:complete len:440 (+),score=110.22 TRINITY_DN15751_c0_g1_i1:127-1320(+)